MKSLLAKIFMIVASAFCMLQGLVLVAVGLGRLSSEKLMALYSGLMTTPKALISVFWVGAFFVVLGFILLVISSRTRQAPHMIDVEKDGKPLSIPEMAVRKFILEVIEQSPYASDVSIDFEHKANGKEVEIHISAGLDGVSSIYKELDEIETAIKGELARVFEWKEFTIKFHLRGIKVEHKKKDEASGKVEKPSDLTPASAEAATEVADEEETVDEADESIKDQPAGEGEKSESIDEGLFAKKEKEPSKASSFFSKILSGK